MAGVGGRLTTAVSGASGAASALPVAFGRFLRGRVRLSWIAHIQVGIALNLVAFPARATDCLS